MLLNARTERVRIVSYACLQVGVQQNKAVARRKFVSCVAVNSMPSAVAQTQKCAMSAYDENRGFFLWLISYGEAILARCDKCRTQGPGRLGFGARAQAVVTAPTRNIGSYDLWN